MGRIGKKLAKYATAFGMGVCWYDPYVDHVSFKSQRVKSLNKFDKSRPASIIYKCKNKKIYIDEIVQSK